MDTRTWLAAAKGLILLFSLTVRAGFTGDWQVGKSATTAGLNARGVVPVIVSAFAGTPGHALTFPKVSGPCEMMTSTTGPHDVLFSDPRRFFVIHSAP